MVSPPFAMKKFGSPMRPFGLTSIPFACKTFLPEVFGKPV